MRLRFDVADFDVVREGIPGEDGREGVLERRVVRSASRRARLRRSARGPVASLRQKIEAHPAHPDHILTVHRLGYRFV